jgi:hypothetical protein
MEGGRIVEEAGPGEAVAPEAPASAEAREEQP